MRRELSVPADVLDGDLRLAATAARALGVGGVVLDLARLPMLGGLSDTGRREMRGVFERQEITLVATQTALPGRGLLDPKEADRSLGQLVKAVQTTAALRIPGVCVDLGMLPVAAPVAPRRELPREGLAGLIVMPGTEDVDRYTNTAPTAPVKADAAGAARVAAMLSELAAVCERHGIPVAFGSSLASTSSLHAAVQPIGCPWFGFDFDPAVAARDGIGAAAALDLLGTQLFHARAKDLVLGEAGRSQPSVIGSGDLDFAELLQLLDDTPYAGPLLIDPAGLSDARGAIRRGIEILRPLIAAH